MIKDKFVIYENSINKKSEWARWAIMNNQLKEKGGTGFWMQNRKQILVLPSVNKGTRKVDIK